MSENYEENGYIVRRGLVPLDLIEARNERFDAVADGRTPPAPNLQVARNVQIAKGLVEPATPAHGIAKLNFVQADPVFERFSRHSFSITTTPTGSTRTTSSSE